MYAAHRSATALMVKNGLTPKEEGIAVPSTTYKLIQVGVDGSAKTAGKQQSFVVASPQRSIVGQAATTQRMNGASFTEEGLSVLS